MDELGSEELIDQHFRARERRREKNIKHKIHNKGLAVHLSNIYSKRLSKHH